MSENTIQNLVETRKRVVNDVNLGLISVGTGAQILGISRVGLWKLRRKVKEHGEAAITGRKRGPKSYYRVANRTPDWIEDKVANLFDRCGVGADRLCWLLDDFDIHLSRATVYRILVRRRLLIPHKKEARKPVTLYTKGYPGEEVQIDTTEPFGKHGPILISAIDDYSRWAMADCYERNLAANAAKFLKVMVATAPFPITTVRTDNGSEFKAEFKSACTKLGINIIRNPVKHPTSNGKVERLHRIIEEECFWRVQAYKGDLDYARYWLSRYLAWYNTKRRHGGFGMEGKTPQERIEDWIIDHDPVFPGPDVNETLILYTAEQVQKHIGLW